MLLRSWAARFNVEARLPCHLLAQVPARRREVSIGMEGGCEEASSIATITPRTHGEGDSGFRRWAGERVPLPPSVTDAQLWPLVVLSPSGRGLRCSCTRGPWRKSIVTPRLMQLPVNCKREPCPWLGCLSLAARNHVHDQDQAACPRLTTG